MSEEEWRAVPGIDGLEVSSIGRVKKHGKLSKVYVRVSGYYVGFRCAGYPVHHLMAAAFLGFHIGFFCNRDPSTLVVHHKNWDARDNRVENLEVMPRMEQLRLLRERFKQESQEYYKSWRKSSQPQ